MEEYLIAFKNKKKKLHENKRVNYSSKFKVILSKFLLAIIFFLCSIIYTNMSDDNLLYYKEHILSESLPFTRIRGWYENLFGEVIPSNESVQTVFAGKLMYKSISDYLDGEVLEVDNESLVNNIASGVVVFIGDKEGYGNTVIIQGIDGIDIWYGNITNVSVNLYDYIEKEHVIGQTTDDKLYLVIKKDNDYLKYEDYKN